MTDTPRVRPRSVSVKRPSADDRAALQAGRLESPNVRRLPLTRAECIDSPRPCLYVTCRYNLFLDVTCKAGAIKLNFPDRAPDEMPPEASCVLDLAARGPMTCEETARAMNLTRERARQIEQRALEKLRATPDNAALAEYADEPPAQPEGQIEPGESLPDILAPYCVGQFFGYGEPIE